MAISLLDVGDVTHSAVGCNVLLDNELFQAQNKLFTDLEHSEYLLVHTPRSTGIHITMGLAVIIDK